MKTALVSSLILFITGSLSAQPDEQNEGYYTFGISGVTMTVIKNQDTVAFERRSYDKEGYNTSRFFASHYGKTTVVTNDTFLIRSPEMYTWIDRGDRQLYDSSHTITSKGPDFDSTRQDYFKGGKIVLRDLYVTDGYDSKRYYITPGRKYKAGIHTTTKEFDAQRRMIAHHESDTTASGAHRELKMGYGYYVTYGKEYKTTEHYWNDGSTTRKTHVVFTGNNYDWDSTIMYDDNGAIESYYAIYQNQKGQDTLSVGRDKDGIVTNRNTTTYTRYSEKTEHADGTGFVFKTDEVLYNEHDLIVRRVETDHRTNEVCTYLYAYTYY